MARQQQRNSKSRAGCRRRGTAVCLGLLIAAGCISIFVTEFKPEFASALFAHTGGMQLTEEASSTELPKAFLRDSAQGLEGSGELGQAGSAAGSGEIVTTVGATSRTEVESRRWQGQANARASTQLTVQAQTTQLPQVQAQSRTQRAPEAGFFLPLEWNGKNNLPLGSTGLGLVLVTSIFFSNVKQHEHHREIYACLATNMQNPHIKELHVFFEITQADNVTKKYYELRYHLNKAVGLPYTTVLPKLRWKPIYSPPMYSTFLEYIDQHLTGELVALANADVVFDDTLSLINPEHFAAEANGQQNAYVLSVESPIFGDGGAYKERFGKDCDSQRRCTIGKYNGWLWGGRSWDAYIYRPPLPRKFKFESVSFPMFWLKAENNVGKEMVRSGLKISNPCLHVHVYHWHCIGEKMHGDLRSSPLDDTPYLNLMPCWDCPGLLRPAGTDALADLCVDGKRQPVPEELQSLFVRPENTELCCSIKGCDYLLTELPKTLKQPKAHMQPSQVPLCRKSVDVDCIVHSARERYWRYVEKDVDNISSTASPPAE